MDINWTDEAYKIQINTNCIQISGKLGEKLVVEAWIIYSIDLIQG